MRRAAIFVLAASACAAKSEPGDAAREAAPLESLCDRYSADASQPDYATIQRIFDENCNGCHAPLADLPLTPGPAWPRLVGQRAPAAEACGGVLVEPGAPAASYLYTKLSSDRPCAGSRMPRGDFGPAPLPDCVVAIVYRWILEGAPGPGGALPGDAGAGTGDATPAQ